jgi:predicted lysophospholipase L1 biosynthesis ABC-type transport system permease subunit
VGALALDFKLGLRMLRKYPALSIVGGLGMAVAIAVAVALFTFMLFYYSHPPVPDGHRIVALENQNVMNDDDWRATLFDYHRWRESLASVEGVASEPLALAVSVLLLSAAGIAALMSFAVTRRRREIGIRVALGASHGRLMGAVFMRPARQLGLGLVIGAVAAAALDNLTGGQMLDGRAVLLVPLVAALMVLAGLLATLAPARRAMRIHPVQALRD